MDSRKNNVSNNSKMEGWLLLAAASAIVLLLFVRLYNATGPELERANTALLEHRAILLDKGLDKDLLTRIITEGNYYTDERDINLLADSLSQKLYTAGRPDNLGALNKKQLCYYSTFILDISHWRRRFPGPAYGFKRTTGFRFPIVPAGVNRACATPGTTARGRWR